MMKTKALLAAAALLMSGCQSTDSAVTTVLNLQQPPQQMLVQAASTMEQLTSFEAQVKDEYQAGKDTPADFDTGSTSFRVIYQYKNGLLYTWQQSSDQSLRISRCRPDAQTEKGESILAADSVVVFIEPGDTSCRVSRVEQNIPVPNYAWIDPLYLADGNQYALNEASSKEAIVEVSGFASSGQSGQYDRAIFILDGNGRISKQMVQAGDLEGGTYVSHMITYSFMDEEILNLEALDSVFDQALQGTPLQTDALHTDEWIKADS